MEEVAPRSYTVKTEEGQMLRRNLRSFLKTQELLKQDDPTVTTSADSPSLESESGEPVEQAQTSPTLRISKCTVKPPDILNL